MALTKMQRILEGEQKRAQGKRGDRREGLKAQVSVDAIMAAVKHEGKYILGSEGAGWWKDMERRYPHLNLLKYKDTGDSPNGHRCRYGKVTRRFIPGQGWFVWRGGEFVRDPATP